MIIKVQLNNKVTEEHLVLQHELWMLRPELFYTGM